MKITRTQKSTLPNVDFDNLTFGKTFTDHMLLCTFKNGAWQEPEIHPYQKLEMPLSLHALHYGQAAFEGMKAYRQKDGGVALFRPEENWKRLNRSAVRLLMPEVPKEIFIGGLNELIKLDKDWVPSKPDMSLYIRPFIFSSSDFIAARPSEEYIFAIICSPVSAYYTGAVKVKVERDYSRSAPGGIGFTKAAGNYGGAFFPTEKAKQQGFTQILWTDPKTHEYVEESGTMNVLFVVGNKMITPALSDRILAGITRASILELGKELGYEVEERPISVVEIQAAATNGTLKEAFGMGTAAVVSMISHIGFNDDDIVEIPVPDNGIGASVKKKLNDIRTGISPDTHHWMLKVN